MIIQYEKEIAIAKEIARKAGVVMREHFFADQNIERKADDTPLTIADTKINSLVIEELAKHFAYDGVIGEEESTAGYGLGRRWFCDPIDGTKAFVAGLPTAMFSLALVVDGTPVLGVAHDPFLDLLYEGRRGCGSFMNGAQLRVSKKALAGEYLGVTSNAERVQSSSHLEHRDIGRLVAQKARLVGVSGAVYKSCLVARGRLVGYLERLVNAHDMAAVEVIVEEAGGKVTGFDGARLNYSKPFRGAIISNDIVHEKLVASVQ